MKTFLCLCLAVLSVHVAQATHLLGGYIQATPIANSSLTYRISVILYMDGVQGGAAANQTDAIPICFGDGTTATSYRASRVFTNNQTASVNSFTVIHTYAGPSTYTISVMLQNRSAVQNITNAGNQLFSLNSTVLISLANQTPTPGFPEPAFRIGAGKKATISLKATDSDGDSLVYGLAKPLSGLETCGWQAAPSYRFPNDVTQQGTFKLNSRTGDLVWDTPTALGRYTVAILISEFRNGLLISQTMQEVTLIVDDQAGNPTPIPAYEPAIEGNGIITALPNYLDSDFTLTTFPSPVDDQLQVIILTSNPTNATIQLVDVGGRKLYEQDSAKSSRQHEHVINMGSLTPGVYILRAVTGNRSLSRKIVKR